MTSEQKKRIQVSQDLLDWSNKDCSFLKNITTSDETWVYDYDVERKGQRSQWVRKSSRDRKKHVKVLIFEGIVVYRFQLE